MSTKKGGGQSRKPAHQNSFAFQHNPKSKKTAIILKMPNEGLCKHCWDKVEWKKKYRKYRPLTQPSVCRDCTQRAVTAAYHKICQSCAGVKGVCAWCCERRDIVKRVGQDTLESVTKEIEIKVRNEGLSLRKKKSLIREASKKFSRPRTAAEDSLEGKESESLAASSELSNESDSDVTVEGRVELPTDNAALLDA